MSAGSRRDYSARAYARASSSARSSARSSGVDRRDREVLAEEISGLSGEDLSDIEGGEGEYFEEGTAEEDLEEDNEFSKDNLMKNTVSEIKDMMRARDIGPMTGRKEVLVDRFIEKLKAKQEAPVIRISHPLDFAPRKTAAERRRDSKFPVASDYRIKASRKVIMDLISEGKYDEAAEKLKGYVGTDKVTVIAYLLSKDYLNSFSMNDTLGLLDAIIHYSNDNLSYNDLRRYMMPFLTDTIKEVSENGTEQDVADLLEDLNGLVADGLSKLTVIIAAARGGAIGFVTSLQDNVDYTADLASEIAYLMTIVDSVKLAAGN